MPAVMATHSTATKPSCTVMKRRTLLRNAFTATPYPADARRHRETCLHARGREDKSHPKSAALEIGTVGTVDGIGLRQHVATDLARCLIGIAHHDESDRHGRDNHAGGQGNPFNRNEAIFNRNETTNVLKRFHGDTLLFPATNDRGR